MNLPFPIHLKEILTRYKAIDSKTHKGIQGHALLIGGSYGKIGSVFLASKAALKSGCGLVTCYIPKCGYSILQTALPEAMVITDRLENHLSQIAFTIEPQAIGIGPGMGQELETQNALHEFLKTNKRQLVIDADALNILAHNLDWMQFLPSKTILTPHIKELERLIGTWENEVQKMQKTIDFSLQHDVIVVVKNAPTQIICGETIYVNTTGNAALATAGSGDVLTGIIASLLAQAYEPLDAAIIGTFLHGKTADLALPEMGYQSFIASDIIDYIGRAYLSLRAL